MASLLESSFAWLRTQLASQSERTTAPLTYTPDGMDAFEVNCILGEQAGGLEYNQATGDTQKVFRMPAYIRTADMIANGVTKLNRNAKATINDVDWGLDLKASKWGPEVVKLMLIRREISRHQEMEARESV